MFRLLLTCRLAALAIAAAVVSSACAGRGSTTAPAGSGALADKERPAAPAPVAVLQSLPSLDSLREASTALVNNYLNASECSAISPSGASTSSLDLMLDAAPGELAWGIYVADITPQITQRWLDLLLTYPDGTPEDEPVWIALADYGSGYWEFHDVHSEGSTFDLSAARYLSPGQTLSFAVLAYDGGTVTCEGVYLNASGLNSPPLADLNADLTSGAAPLSVDFDASASSDVDGNIASYGWDFEGDGLVDEYTTLPAASHVYNGGGSFTARLTVQDVYSEQDSAELTISVNGGNASPLADFLVLPDTVDTFEAVVLDGSASTDSDGSIVKYEWDTDGDGSFETDTSPLPVTAGFNFTTGGVRVLSLRVTDNDGATDTVSAPLRVRGWSALINIPVPGEPAMSNTGFSSLALVAGRPAFSCVSTNGVLRYLRAEDETGASWGAAQRLSNSNSVNYESSLSLINGRPAVAFWNEDTQNLRYVRASDAEGTNWPDPLTVTGNVTAQSIKLIEFNGMPAIGYCDASGQSREIYFLNSADAEGSAWSNPLFAANATFSQMDLSIIAGRPAFCFFGDGTLLSGGYYLRAADDAGTQWNGVAEQIQSAGGDTFVIGGRLIETGSGLPAIAGMALDQGLSTKLGIRYCRGDSNGQNWATEKTIGANRDASCSGLTLVGGKPALMYAGRPAPGGISTLYYAGADDSEGSTWPAAVEIAQSPSQIRDIEEVDLIDLNGSPGALIEVADEYYFIYLTQ